MKLLTDWSPRPIQVFKNQSFKNIANLLKWKVAPLYINHMRRTTSNLISTNKSFKFSLKKLVYDSPDNFPLKKSSLIKWWAIIPTHALKLNWCLVVWVYNCARTYFILIIYVRFAFTAHCFSIKKHSRNSLVPRNFMYISSTMFCRRIVK